MIFFWKIKIFKISFLKVNGKKKWKFLDFLLKTMGPSMSILILGTWKKQSVGVFWGKNDIFCKKQSVGVFLKKNDFFSFFSKKILLCGTSQFFIKFFIKFKYWLFFIQSSWISRFYLTKFRNQRENWKSFLIFLFCKS